VKNYEKKQLTNPSVARGRGVIVYSIAIFVSAFLLFQVQLLMGKYITPWFGGSPEVWTTCMLFFQVFLLAGYAYAHVSTAYLSNRSQVILHVILIIIALAVLPIIPLAKYKPQPPYNPIVQIMFLLTVSVGLPYFILSTTGPLLQKWFSRVNLGIQPYRLYAFSNAGSLIGLISYPFIVEPSLSRQQQANIFSASLAVFAVLCTGCMIYIWKQRSPVATKNINTEKQIDDTLPGLGTRLLWLALAAGASVELLAVTNKICQDIAVIPFLWVVPLCLYLLSFIICFHHERWYVRSLFLGLFVLSVAAITIARKYEGEIGAKRLIYVYSAMLFFCCMVCHGELFRLRPSPKHLTGYYLMIALGGALGGIFVGIISPLIFDTYSELYIGLLGCVMFVLLADKSDKFGIGMRKWLWIAIIIIVGIVSSTFEGKRSWKNQRAILNSRNFFGVLTIWESNWDKPEKHLLVMQHGTTSHGMQYIKPEKRHDPISYYSTQSGVGLAINNFKTDRPRRIGVVGLGAGTLAIYGKENDYFRFYEINPEVEKLARKYFTYLSDCPAKIDVVIGDARLSLEAEDPQQFDILVLDAFSGDAVPSHLLTEEAFQIYLKHITPDGIIAVHTSSLYLDIESVAWKQAENLGLKNIWIQSDESQDKAILPANWMLITRNEDFINQPNIRKAGLPLTKIPEKTDLWTDDHINLFQILQ